MTAAGACRFGAAPYVPALTLEKPLYVRERNDGLYRPITYLLAKIFDEIFVTIIASLIFSAFVFYVVDLQGDFILFWLTYFVALSTGIVLAYVVAVLAPNMDIANAALPTYVVRSPSTPLLRYSAPFGCAFVSRTGGAMLVADRGAGCRQARSDALALIMFGACDHVGGCLD